MAELTGKAISELASTSSVGDDDLFAISQSGSSKKISGRSIKALSFYRNSLIPNRSNLNSYTTPGSYYCPSGTDAATLTNAPYTSGNFRLDVYQCGSGESTYFVQAVLTTSGQTLFMRECANGTFGAWRRYLDSTDLSQLAYLPGTYSMSTVPAWGVVTGGTETCSVYIPVPKLLTLINTVTVSSLITGLRVSNGYIGGSSSFNATSYILSSSVGKSQNGLLYMNLQNSNGWWSTNNVPVAGTVDVIFTLS